jgi:hypothetical protein
MMGPGQLFRNEHSVNLDSLRGDNEDDMLYRALQECFLNIAASLRYGEACDDSVRSCLEGWEVHGFDVLKRMDSKNFRIDLQLDRNMRGNQRVLAAVVPEEFHEFNKQWQGVIRGD